MYELISQYCGICLKEEPPMQHVAENDVNNMQIIFKLKCTVPDIDWTSDFSICSCCCEQLNSAYTFRELCVQSQKFRQQSTLEHFTKATDHLADDVCDDNCTDVDLDDATLKGTPELLSALQSYKETSDVEFEEHKSKTETEGASKGRRFKQFECPGCTKKYTTQYGVKKHTKICKKIEKTVENKGGTNDLPQESCLANHAPLPSNEGMSTPALLSAQEGVASSAPSALETSRVAENTCAQCGATFGNKYLVRRHVRNVHAVEKLFGCAQCPRRFASAVYLAAHERYHRRDRSHICATCGKGYITASDLYHHEKIHANRRAYRCDACDKGFNTSSDLHKHRICVHVDRSLWKYVCAYCEKRFPLKTNLDTHTKTHTGERRFACHLCERRCISRSVLLRHVETHSNVQTFKCHVCQHTYKYKKSLDLHLAKVHGLGAVPPKVKRYFCHVCPKSYFVNSKLQKHLRTHTGDKPFKCPTCQKGFVEKSYVKQHMKTSHGITDWQQL